MQRFEVAMLKGAEVISGVQQQGAAFLEIRKDCQVQLLRKEPSTSAALLRHEGTRRQTVTVKDHLFRKIPSFPFLSFPPRCFVWSLLRADAVSELRA